MNNELLEQKSWWKRHWKWLVSVFVLLFLCSVLFFTSGMGSVTTDLAQAYAQPQLYENALEKVRSNEKVKKLLGEIEPIDQLAILEGAVHFSDNNKTVNSSIRVIGSKGKAIMDLVAAKPDTTWIYKELSIRIKKPASKKQKISIISPE